MVIRQRWIKYDVNATFSIHHIRHIRGYWNYGIRILERKEYFYEQPVNEESFFVIVIFYKRESNTLTCAHTRPNQNKADNELQLLISLFITAPMIIARVIASNEFMFHFDI